MHLPSNDQLRERYLKLEPQHVDDPKKVKIFQAICQGAFLFAMSIREAFPRMEDPSQIHPAIPPLLEAIDEVVITANEVLADKQDFIEAVRQSSLSPEQKAMWEAEVAKEQQVTDGQVQTEGSAGGDEKSAAASEPGSVPGSLLRAGGGSGPGGEGDAGGLPGGERGIDDPPAGQRDDSPQPESGGQSGEAAG